MDNFNDLSEQTIGEKLLFLKNTLHKQRDLDIGQRLKNNPYATEQEYLLGAFIEMYEPYLREIVWQLFEKGYALSTSSGFGMENGEYQIMTGDFSIDFVTKNRLEKIEVKLRDQMGAKAICFYPKEALLDEILKKWRMIVEALPDKGKVTRPLESAKADRFRRDYLPKNLKMQNQRLFENLKFETQNQVFQESEKRNKEKRKPKKIELMLGVFLEKIESQVRQAIILMNKKGYSTDKSGFMENPCEQMVEGDFILDEKTKRALEEEGVKANANPSGYTRLQFSPLEANIDKIKRQWNKIISLLPDRKKQATISMTKKARDFRLENNFKMSVKDVGN